ncbi:MAG: hypothetical protein GY874_11800 [Desulfobacteraceae bacterium]|nr:hypothetical protein [Desulfobacteraceae bacterium]
MGNHFHLLVRMIPEHNFSDEEIISRYENFYGDTKQIGPDQLPALRRKLANLSEFIRDIKVNFIRYYNKRHQRLGYFWGDRFKSLIVGNGQTFKSDTCLSYRESSHLSSFLEPIYF